MTANGQYVRVKRMADTYFVSLDLANGATVNDLYLRAAAVMNVREDNLRLCLMDDQGRVTFLTRSEQSDAAQAPLIHPPHSFSLNGDTMVYAVLQLPDGWEEPCIVDYPVENESAIQASEK